MKIRNVKDDISTAITLNPEKQPTKGKEVETLEGSNTQFVMSNFIIWNIRGANSATFRRNCETLVKEHNLTFLVLLKMKMTEHKYLTEALHFDAQLQSATEELSGGIVVM